jgi:glyoxylase-like metal-dependent hydrolase (beta-lactamase superfamily II)
MFAYPVSVLDNDKLRMTTATEKYQTVGPGVIAIDTEYMRPLMDASHLIVSDGRAAFVDTGTSYSVKNMLAALESVGLAKSAVDYILLTHVHLDHAGGAGQLAQALPQAKVVVHPRGAPHMIDPAKLIAGTKAVYGEQNYYAMYGEILPIPAERIIAIEDGASLALGHRRLDFFYSPGHALHHYCIADIETREVFTGDTFGVSYREFDTAAGSFIFPTTTPTQFDPAQLHASIDRIAALQPEAVYLTHYSRVTGVAKLSRDLHADLDVYVALARASATDPERTQRMQEAMQAHFQRRLAAHGFKDNAGVAAKLLAVDVELNVQGLEHWLSRGG